MKIIYLSLALGSTIFSAGCHHEKPTVESDGVSTEQSAPRPVSTRY